MEENSNEITKVIYESNMSDVVTFLLNYAFDNNIGTTLFNDYDETWPSVAIPESNMMMINMKWYEQEEIPIMIAHEIGHMLDDTDCIDYETNNIIKTKSECRASKIGLNLLIDYCHKMDHEFNSIDAFMHQFKIPKNLRYLLETKINC